MSTAPREIVGAFGIDYLDSDLGPYLFLRASIRRDHRHIAYREFGHGVDASALPDRADVLHTLAGDGAHREVIAEFGGALVLLRSWKATAKLWVSAADPDTPGRVAGEIAARVPPAPPAGVEVSFTDASCGTRSLPLSVRPWRDVADLYPDRVRAALAGLMAHRPASAEGRRLLLWYGEPGTGKTTAVRALVHEWREWAAAVVVTDPERLLTDGRYLRRVLFDADEERWRLVVLEDTEALLRKETTPAAGLGRLLNMADGLLGQGMRWLFLLTTNEPVAALHPALVRPGRCLAQVEFTALPAAQAARLLGRPVDGERTLAQLMAEASVRAVADPAPVGQYL